MNNYQVFQGRENRLYLTLPAYQSHDPGHLSKPETPRAEVERGVIVIDMFAPDEEVYEF